jgi:hypothetical protein
MTADDRQRPLTDSPSETAYRVALTERKGHPTGALPGCPGRIEVSVEHHEGSGYISPCVVEVSVTCEAGMCWWGMDVDGPVTLPLMIEAKRLHDYDARAASTADTEGES